uniref:Uncharacterized protein n=1 Tax=Rhizophora mucronata TaxID=61149 RepID=A0A2P2NWW9_RHIMU
MHHFPFHVSHTPCFLFLISAEKFTAFILCLILGVEFGYILCFGLWGFHSTVRQYVIKSC